MSYFTSLPPTAKLLDVFRKFPESFLPLIEYHQRLLREASPFSAGEREWMAAYVSALNQCSYCAGVHEATARQFGVDERVMAQMLEDVDAAAVPANMKPVFRYLRKLTLSPANLTENDVQEIFEAGWGEDALHHLVAIGALFNCMNRLVEGFGITAKDDYFSVSAERLSSPQGYTALTALLRESTANEGET